MLPFTPCLSPVQPTVIYAELVDVQVAAQEIAENTVTQFVEFCRLQRLRLRLGR